MKQSLLHLTAYNFWANKRTVEMLKSNISLIDAEVKSSFPSLRKTMYHIWGAEEVWYKRLHGESLPKISAMDFSGSFEDAAEKFISVSISFASFVQGKDESYFQTPCTYKDTQGNSYTNPHWQMIMHCMNHSSFHRGQIITLLRKLGVTSLLRTDMIVFFRETKGKD